MEYAEVKRVIGDREASQLEDAVLIALAAANRRADSGRDALCTLLTGLLGAVIINRSSDPAEVARLARSCQGRLENALASLQCAKPSSASANGCTECAQSRRGPHEDAPADTPAPSALDSLAGDAYRLAREARVLARETRHHLGTLRVLGLRSKLAASHSRGAIADSFAVLRSGESAAVDM